MFRNRHESANPSPAAVRCGTCNEAMPPTYWRRPGPAPAPVHCDGSDAGWGGRNSRPNPHHGRRAYHCWRCQASLGCDNCAGTITEILCMRCDVMATPEAFAQHGAILNTPIMLARRGGHRAPGREEYPEHYQAALARAEALEPRPRRVASIPPPSLHALFGPSAPPPTEEDHDARNDPQDW